ncbi:hypothetical protein COLO4_13750 [Corchorus olitorius]|uniref:Uncharacterized protein n=1 Tax=Corchorus olitorius TaxID=93759 RepID=A0A1R3JUY0_9ROSI|nr:hypothetical protein COLO4_13750 [Corchorus olitorius]
MGETTTLPALEPLPVICMTICEFAMLTSIMWFA